MINWLAQRLLAMMIRRDLRGWTRLAGMLDIGEGRVGALRLRNR